MDIKKEQNFFEGRVTEYQKASCPRARRRRRALTERNENRDHRLRRDPGRPGGQARLAAAADELPAIDVARRSRASARAGLDAAGSDATARSAFDLLCRHAESPRRSTTLAAAQARGDRTSERPRSSSRATGRAVVARCASLGDAPRVTAPRPLGARRGDADRQERTRRREGLLMRRSRRSGTHRRASGESRGSSAARATWSPGTSGRSRSRSARRSSRSTLDPAPATRLAERVSRRARSLGLDRRARSRSQDIVQEELMLSGHMRSPSATSSTAPSAPCCARRAGSRRRRLPAAHGARADGSRARLDGRRPARADRVRAASGSTSRSTASEIERSCAARSTTAIRAPISTGHRPEREDADRARRRLRVLRRPHPAHLHLRGGARLGHPSRRRRRPERRAPPRASAGARARHRDQAPRPGACSSTTSTSSPPRSIRPPTSASTSSACRRSTTAT